MPSPGEKVAERSEVGRGIRAEICSFGVVLVLVKGRPSSVTAFAVPPMNFGMLATGKHGNFRFAARSTTPEGKAGSLPCAKGGGCASVQTEGLQEETIPQSFRFAKIQPPLHKGALSGGQ